jgi:hypothetical protein
MYYTILYSVRALHGYADMDISMDISMDLTDMNTRFFHG